MNSQPPFPLTNNNLHLRMVRIVRMMMMMMMIRSDLMHLYLKRQIDKHTARLKPQSIQKTSKRRRP